MSFMRQKLLFIFSLFVCSVISSDAQPALKKTPERETADSGGNARDSRLLPWKEGQHVSYLLEYPDGRWQTHTLFLMDKRSDGFWEAVVEVKSPQREYALFYKINLSKKHVQFMMYKIKAIRGTRPTMEEAAPIILLYQEIFNQRTHYEKSDERKQNKVNIENCCRLLSLNKVIAKSPGEKTNSITLYHRNIPITGLADLEFEDRRYRLKLLSYGTQEDLAPLKKDPRRLTYFDLSNSRRINRGYYSLAYPSGWVLLSGEKGPASNSYFYQRNGMGGRLGFLLVEYNKTPESPAIFFSTFEEKMRAFVVKEDPGFKFIANTKHNIVGGEVKGILFEKKESSTLEFRHIGIAINRERTKLIMIMIQHALVHTHPQFSRFENHKKSLQKILTGLRFN